MELEPMIRGVLAGDRRALAKAITLVESTQGKDIPTADRLVQTLLPHSAKRETLRLGVSGIPGVGKSSLIESLGCYGLDRDPHLQLAVLAIDPSSPVHGGSILGDKTRMEQLAAHPRVFIRPSPNAGALGGVTRKSRDIIVLMEAAGFPFVVVETVGVGQADHLVDSLVDIFMLLHMPHTGDELQGIKKGALELADLVVVNKADGDVLKAAQLAKAQLSQARSFITADGKRPSPILLASAREKTGLREIWDAIQGEAAYRRHNGSWQAKRRRQAKDWFWQEFQRCLEERLALAGKHEQALLKLQSQVEQGLLPASTAARQFLEHCWPDK